MGLLSLQAWKDKWVSLTGRFADNDAFEIGEDDFREFAEDLADTVITMGVDFPVTESQGTYVPGNQILATHKIATVVKNMLNRVLYPTLNAPSVSITQNNGALQEIGASVNTTVTLGFSKGSIMGSMWSDVWNTGISQGARAGRASKFFIRDVFYNGTGSSSPALDIASYAYTFSNRIVVQGYNNFTGYVEHLAGIQPVDSTRADFDLPLPAGTIEAATVRYEGVFPIYASTSSITVGTKQALVSMLSGNNVLITLVAESGGNKQFFEIPDAWLDARPLVDVEYFNAFTNQYDITGKKSDFTVSNNTRTLNSVEFGLKRFTYNGVARGEQKIRLKF
ncbi:hypothetical protein [Pontibacter beigongshangensis]|uniref:hypothetical protein n=1 Tax=Pontibacter beigongshangensis TaxID=2574733 RepID=UPI00164F29C1|nr:hypothetical protein [Pontibacter beigongshangensis]